MTFEELYISNDNWNADTLLCISIVTDTVLHYIKASEVLTLYCNFKVVHFNNDIIWLK